jgi:hypothetical protein
MSEVIDESERPVKASLPPRLRMTIICLRISTVIYVLLGVAAVVFIPERIIGIIMLFVSLACAAGVELVIYGLKNYRHWGWIAGLIVCILYIPSVFVILGGLGM